MREYEKSPGAMVGNAWLQRMLRILKAAGEGGEDGGGEEERRKG